MAQHGELEIWGGFECIVARIGSSFRNALASSRGSVMPTLESAVARFLEDRELGREAAPSLVATE